MQGGEVLQVAAATGSAGLRSGMVIQQSDRLAAALQLAMAYNGDNRRVQIQEP